MTTQSYTQWKEDRLASRRLQLLLIDPALLRGMITGGDIRVRYELPADVSVLTIQPDSSGLFLHALIHSETFDPAPPYERPPLWQGPMWQERVGALGACPQCGEPLFCPCMGANGT